MAWHAPCRFFLRRQLLSCGFVLRARRVRQSPTTAAERSSVLVLTHSAPPPALSLTLACAACNPAGKVVTLAVWFHPDHPPSAGAALRPAVVFFHGGAWAGGSFLNVRGGPDELAGGMPQGYYLDLLQQVGGEGGGGASEEYAPVVVSISYRLTSMGWWYGDDAVLWDAQREDGLAAVAWLHEHASALRVDADRLACLGLSSGGHVCASTAIAGAAAPETRLAAFAVFYAPIYFGDLYPAPPCCCPAESASAWCVSCEAVPFIESECTGGTDDRSSRWITQLIGETPGGVLAWRSQPQRSAYWDSKLALMRDLNPLHRLTDDCPPVFAAHGTEDATAPYMWGIERLRSALGPSGNLSATAASERVAAGRDEFVLVEGEDHGFPVSAWLPVYEQGAAWLARELSAAPVAAPTQPAGPSPTPSARTPTATEPARCTDDQGLLARLVELHASCKRDCRLAAPFSLADAYQGVDLPICAPGQPQYGAACVGDARCEAARAALDNVGDAACYEAAELGPARELRELVGHQLKHLCDPGWRGECAPSLVKRALFDGSCLPDCIAAEPARAYVVVGNVAVATPPLPECERGQAEYGSSCQQARVCPELGAAMDLRDATCLATLEGGLVEAHTPLSLELELLHTAAMCHPAMRDCVGDLSCLHLCGMVLGTTNTAPLEGGWCAWFDDAATRHHCLLGCSPCETQVIAEVLYERKGCGTAADIIQTYAAASPSPPPPWRWGTPRPEAAGKDDDVAEDDDEIEDDARSDDADERDGEDEEQRAADDDYDLFTADDDESGAQELRAWPAAMAVAGIMLARRV